MFLGLWEFGHYQLSEEGSKFLPSVEEVFNALVDLFREENFLDDVLASLQRIFLSFFAAVAVAVPLGVLMGCFHNLRSLLNPTLAAWRYLPAPSFVPLFLVWFGPTDTAKLALLFVGVVFFLIALILDNVEAVPREYVEAALTMGASRWGVVMNIVVPAAAPAIFDSMRNMIAVGWTYLVIAEIVAAQDGIGSMMMRAGRTLSVDQIMAGILTIGVLGCSRTSCSASRRVCCCLGQLHDKSEGELEAMSVVPLIRATSVSKDFNRGAVQALGGITTDIYKDQITVFVGPSGSGKTTLLRMVAGLEYPTRGSVSVGGRVIQGPGPDRGMIFQAYTSFPWLTARKNVEYGLKMLGMRRDERRRRAMEFLRHVRLDHVSERYPGPFSGGMKQRVALARTLAQNPRIPAHG